MNVLRRVYVALFPRIDAEVERAVGDAETLFDAGCGPASPVTRFSYRRDWLVGADLYEPYLAQLKKTGAYDRLLLMDAAAAARTFRPKEFDCALALDLIEHLPKEKGRELLDALERVAHKVVILTPNGYVERPSDDGNPLQAHISGWTAADFEARGYVVTGLQGWKPLRAGHALPSWIPYKLRLLIGDLSNLVVRRRPASAVTLLAVKS